MLYLIIVFVPGLIRQLGDVSGGQPVGHHVARARVLVRLP